MTGEKEAVRRALPSDAAKIATIHVESSRSAYRGLLPDEHLARFTVAQRTQQWSEIIEQLDIPSSGVLVAERNSEIVGFCHYTRDRDPGPAPDPDGRSAEITSFYIAVNTWRQGVGTALLAHATTAMTDAGYQQATLWVLDTNTPARRFYETQHWDHDGVAKVEDRSSFTIRETRYRRQLADQ